MPLKLEVVSLEEANSSNSNNKTMEVVFSEEAAVVVASSVDLPAATTTISLHHLA